MFAYKLEPDLRKNRILHGEEHRKYTHKNNNEKCTCRNLDRASNSLASYIIYIEMNN